MEDFIQLKKNNILKIGIKDADGNDTGEHLEFDLEDIELPLKINKCDLEHRKNIQYAKNQLIIIDKKEDHKGKQMLSFKEEEKLKIMRDFYKKEMEALDLFLGEGGCKKLLNGRNPYYTMYDDINDMLKPIMPKLKENSDNIKNIIKSKYSTNESEGIIE